MRRIWAHKISFFGPHQRDVAHPGSGLAQDLLRLAHLKNHFRKAAPQHALSETLHTGNCGLKGVQLLYCIACWLSGFGRENRRILVRSVQLCQFSSDQLRSAVFHRAPTGARTPFILTEDKESLTVLLISSLQDMSDNFILGRAGEAHPWLTPDQRSSGSRANTEIAKANFQKEGVPRHLVSWHCQTASKPTPLW